MTKFDEAAFFKRPTAFLSAFPVCTQKRCSFLMMTTPGPETNYFHYLASCVDDAGKPRLYVSRYASICDDCQKTSTPWLCSHIYDTVDWIDRGKQDDMAFMYGGNERYRAQETQALQMSTHNYPWRAYLGALAKAPRTPVRNRINSPIFLSVDCACGGKNRTAVYGAYFSDWGSKGPCKMVNVYLDNFDSRGMDDLITIHLIAAIDELTQVDYFASSQIVLIIEDRPALIGSVINREVLRVRKNVVSVRGCGPQNARLPGVNITNSIKQGMTHYMASLLRSGNISYSEHARTASAGSIMLAKDAYIAKLTPAGSDDEVAMREVIAGIERAVREGMCESYDSLCDELHTQMGRWEEKTITTGPEGVRTTKFFYDGKGPNEQLNDDMAITAAMTAYHPIEWAASLKRSLQL